ncbi:unnamed protein product [Adineta steineri]|uniref:Uncharacterized protein n=1 Tax=Adineta steineri TaxID=433720 RepID=A0A819KZB1_9BILA|nr:unnamed protein product [Adineta steineri]
MEDNYDSEVTPMIQSDPSLNLSPTKQNNFVNNRKQNSNNKLFTSFLILFLVFIFISIVAVPILQIVLGSLYINECPIDHRIPIYLIVAGGATLILFITLAMKIIMEKSSLWIIPHGLPVLFCLGWFITGSVWIFHAKSKVQHYRPDVSSTYCQYSVFNCAFGTLFISYGFLFASVWNNNNTSK